MVYKFFDKKLPDGGIKMMICQIKNKLKKYTNK